MSTLESSPKPTCPKHGETRTAQCLLNLKSASKPETMRPCGNPPSLDPEVDEEEQEQEQQREQEQDKEDEAEGRRSGRGNDGGSSW